MTQNRIIGRVLSVDNYHVFIKVETDLKGAYKSGINDIYEIARINSYLIIPVGADRIVTLITRITMKEEVELERSSVSITLPTSARYISATMLGTIAKEDGKEHFVHGVYNFPSLDNPVWYVTEKDLKHIFDDQPDKRKIDYEKDYYLPIGTSPAFQDYKVKICPDQFFVKHAAILGNTGSGKSCTLTSILRNLFKYDFGEEGSGKFLENAHIVIFDTNGEYKNAFLTNASKNDYELKRINAYYYGGEGKGKVPYWLMNWEDFKSLLRPGDGTQAPVLNRAIGLAKNENAPSDTTNKNLISTVELNHFCTMLSAAQEGCWWKAESLSESYKEFKAKLPKDLQNLQMGKGNKSPPPSLISKMKEFVATCQKQKIENQIASEQNIDLPIWFSYQELCATFLDVAISQESSNNNRISEYVSTLRLRMNSFLNDKRMAIPLMLKDSDEINKSILPQFLSLLLGDYNRCFRAGDGENFIKQYNTNNSPLKESEGKTNQITVIDVSPLPFEVLETITALLGRIILEFVSNFLPEQRGKFPIVIVLEEAQNYIAENKDSVAKTVFERIAREGRKYGISLIVSSQRPSELSKTVLSQCNSFVIHRLQNPDDQKYVRGLVSSANADLLDQLPIIPQQHAIITGDCVRTPVLVRIDDVSPTPNSNNPKYIKNWLKDEAIPYEETCERWTGKSLSSESNAP